MKKHWILFKELFPFTFIIIIWIIQVMQGFLQQDWSVYSVYPRTVHGLIGIITSPLLHAGWQHLFGNTVPLIVLGFLLFSSYKGIAGKIFWIIYFLNGTLLWLFARQAIHLGASGVVYGMAAFLFFSGMIRKHNQLAVISLLIVFLYGSMVWGIFPFDPHVSWEAHLYGALTGLILAIIFRKEGPQPKKYFEDEKDEEEIIENEKSPLEIIYTYKEQNENPEGERAPTKENDQ